MPKTRYTGVYVDNNGKFFYQVELGIDKITGKEFRKKEEKIKTDILFPLLVKLIRN